MTHKNQGTREIEAANYAGRVWQCSCGERFEDKSELEQHIGPSAASEQFERDREDSAQGGW